MPRPKNRTPLQANMRRKISELSSQISAAEATGGTQSNRRLTKMRAERASYQDTLRRSVAAIAAADVRRRSARVQKIVQGR